MGLLTRDDGEVARSPQEIQQLEAAGYTKCYTARSQKSGPMYGKPCPFFISPEGRAHIETQMGGYYTCPVCQQSHDLLHELPWHGMSETESEENATRDRNQLGYFQAGGGTHIGTPMTDQAQIGEDLVANMREIPGYGPITWWHEGGAAIPSPLDGATRDWGVEVKTLGYDAAHHRFMPGGVRNGYDEKAAKNQQAADLGKKGVLGVLVLLDYRRSVADIYVRECPLEDGGVKAFRSSAGQHLVKEVPFKNPLMDPSHPAPVAAKQPDMPF